MADDILVNSCPPLLIKPKRRMKTADLFRLRDSIHEAFSKSREVIVVDDDMDIFQWIDGKWELLTKSSKEPATDGQGPTEQGPEEVDPNQG